MTCRCCEDHWERQKTEALADWEKELLANQEPVNVAAPEPDDVNRPRHYTWHPSGVEAIEVTEWMGFCLGNAVKYLWRAGLKGDPIKDLEKAKWYIEREIARIKGATD